MTNCNTASSSLLTHSLMFGCDRATTGGQTKQQAELNSQAMALRRGT